MFAGTAKAEKHCSSRSSAQYWHVPGRRHHENGRHLAQFRLVGDGDWTGSDDSTIRRASVVDFMQMMVGVVGDEFTMTPSYLPSDFEASIAQKRFGKTSRQTGIVNGDIVFNALLMEHTITCKFIFALGAQHVWSTRP